jgi:pyruvate dehydrogenase E1 component
VDIKSLLYYHEAKDGQILEEGITEAGSMASFIAAGTSYATHGRSMVPFYIYYSMFGFQRIGDLMWLAGDIKAKGFLLGATSGRTTLNGEGLQHQDGHSLILSSALPTLLTYDPAFAYELAVIIADGMKRMYVDNEELFYYLTLYNENYLMPPMPAGVEQGILRGLYKFRASPLDVTSDECRVTGKSTGNKSSPSPGGEGWGEGERSSPDTRHSTLKAHIFGSGPIIREALRAQEILADKYGVSADVWSATSYKLLRNDALAAKRWNLLHPASPPRKSWLETVLENERGVFVAVSDNVKLVPDQIAPWVPGGLTTLGTDGFGRSDTRERLRRFFEVDAEFTVIATLNALAEKGQLDRAVVAQAIKDLDINPDKLFPQILS